MIDLYYWGTSNGRKITIMLEEVGLPYTMHPINISRDEQFTPEFLAINPNGKIPAIVDREGPGGTPYTVFESGAILIYLAEKVASPLLPTDARGRYDTLQWLMFQMGGIGPMFGQRHHFFRAAEQVPYGIQRYTRETHRLYGVMDRRLAEVPYLAGGAYSIADVATYPWVGRWEWHDIDWADFPNVKRWFDTVGARPAVARGMEIPAIAA